MQQNNIPQDIQADADRLYQELTDNYGGDRIVRNRLLNSSYIQGRMDERAKQVLDKEWEELENKHRKVYDSSIRQPLPVVGESVDRLGQAAIIYRKGLFAKNGREGRAISYAINDFKAGATWANQQPSQGYSSTAIDFAEWLGHDLWQGYNLKDKWQNPYGEIKTTQELYQLFLSQYKLSALIPKCCDVPDENHGTCCGWINAKFMVNKDGIIVTPKHPGFGINFGIWFNAKIK